MSTNLRHPPNLPNLREERTHRLCMAMAASDFDLLAVTGDAWRSDYLRFALDVTPMEGRVIALVFQDADRRPLAFVEHPTEASRLAAEQPGIDVEWAPDPVARTEAALAALTERPDGIGVGLVPVHSAPTGLARGPLSRRAVEATALMDRLMVDKSPAEADAVARATALADEGYAVFRQAAQPGKREYELIGELEAWFRAQGCAENFMIMGSGGPEVRTMRPPGERALCAGDMVTTELTPCVDGYYAQICRTLVIGEPTPAQLSAYAVFEEALEAGIAAVRPGATHGDVARAQNDVFRAHGLGDYVTSKYTRVRGHGMGLYVDGPHVLEDVELVLEPGMTLVVHPNTYHPGAGYIVLGDTVRVTAEGCDVLTRTSRDLAPSTAGRA